MKNSMGYCHKYKYSFMKNTSYLCQILLKLEFPRSIFKKQKKNSEIKLVKIRPLLAIEYAHSYVTKNPTFNQHSIRLSPDPKSHSCVHNTVRDPILRKMNPCDILLLYIFFWYIAVLLYSKKKCMTCPTQVFWSEFWMGTSTQSMYHKCRTFRHISIWTLIINECTYYDALPYVSFSSFPLYPQLYGQVFSPATPIFSTPLLWRSSFTYIASNIELEIFSHTQLYTGWFVNYEHYLG